MCYEKFLDKYLSWRLLPLLLSIALFIFTGLFATSVKRYLSPIVWDFGTVLACFSVFLFFISCSSLVRTCFKYFNSILKFDKE